jgi:plastocyanin
VNGEKEGDNLAQGDTRAVDFDEKGQFKITCEFHPDMLAELWVE